MVQIKILYQNSKIHSTLSDSFYATSVSMFAIYNVGVDANSLLLFCAFKILTSFFLDKCKWNGLLPL